MSHAIHLVKPALLAGIGLMLAACAAAPVPYGYYGPSDYSMAPIYGGFDFEYGGDWRGGGRHDDSYHGGQHGGHFAHGFGHGSGHGGGGGHRG
jgi:hypothetical protein